MIVIGLSCMFYFGAVLWCPPCRASMRDSCCRVLQYVHNSLMVGDMSDRNTDPSKGVVEYGSKEDLILNAMVGFYLNDPW
jgi:hypothetical protein